jgi:ribonuclease D
MRFIEDNQEFEHFCNDIKNADYLAIDTEFMREKTYWAKICLLQIASPNNDHAAVIDSLRVDLNIPIFKDILKNPNIVKVFHAGRQDIEILYDIFAFIPDNIFDTQIAAAVLGHGEQVGYGYLVEKIIGKTVDKSNRYSDWSRRPLREKDLEYALKDVTYLTKIYDYMLDELQKLGRASWIEDEIKNLCDEKIYRPDLRQLWLKLKQKSGSKKYQSILRELAELRELEAMKCNRPRSFILKDETLYSIASSEPKNASELKNIRGLHENICKGPLGRKILAAVSDGIKNMDTVPTYQKPVKLSDQTLQIIDVLKMVLKLSAQENKITPRLIASQDDLQNIATDGLASTRIKEGWRYDIFGQKVEKLLDGRLHISLKNGDFQFIEQ